jgi:hypothetical protein
MKRLLFRIKEALRSSGKHRDAYWWDNAQVEKYKREHESRNQSRRHDLL